MCDVIKRLTIWGGIMVALLGGWFFSIYGVVKFWDAHIVRWFGASAAGNIGIAIIVCAVIWVIFVLKIAEDETNGID